MPPENNHNENNPKQWLISAAILFSAIFISYIGYEALQNNVDITKLSILIFTVFVFIFTMGIFGTKKEGFGPNNLKITGILLVATFATLIAFIDSGMRTAAIGILGAIAGYLFGIKDNQEN